MVAGFFTLMENSFIGEYLMMACLMQYRLILQQFRQQRQSMKRSNTYPLIIIQAFGLGLVIQLLMVNGTYLDLG